ncbi:coiled-coil domain-containing protein 94-like [Melia azedarach]|uniref:Coiled-coil domain-containing protein 94-like n=1 Tax=Melia azedarach TaxID=155640 RepID=A0ACC1XLC4_MELAZ|nr:coiled-coil domain-containing protein 94-like [Melia azedarach]
MPGLCYPPWTSNATLCRDFIYRGTKFNYRKGPAADEKYLELEIKKFRLRVEGGAKRNYGKQRKKERKKRDVKEMKDSENKRCGTRGAAVCEFQTCNCECLRPRRARLEEEEEKDEALIRVLSRSKLVIYPHLKKQKSLGGKEQYIPQVYNMNTKVRDIPAGAIGKSFRSSRPLPKRGQVKSRIAANAFQSIVSVISKASLNRQQLAHGQTYLREH